MTRAIPIALICLAALISATCAVKLPQSVVPFNLEPGSTENNTGNPSPRQMKPAEKH